MEKFGEGLESGLLDAQFQNEDTRLRRKRRTHIHSALKPKNFKTSFMGLFRLNVCVCEGERKNQNTDEQPYESAV